MSAQHAPHDDGADARDPFDIIPPAFDEWPGDTIAEKLRAAEEAPSSTDPREQQRCPECLARRLRPKFPKSARTPDDVPAYVCLTCEASIDRPLPSERAVAEGTASARQLQRVREARGGAGQTGLDAGWEDA
jgi:DNA-directed RNA polymerase subunit RPC12/RpoP